jgi:MarR family transcriptional regulator, organic hydroperoxide resistance regulator
VTDGDPTEEIVEHLFTLVEHLRAGFEAAAADFDLSVAQAKALRHVAVAGPVPMGDLACRMRCDASNVTGIIDRLEDRGLVERRAAPGDRRVKSLVATARGAEVAGAMWRQVRASAIALLQMNDDERGTLVFLLRRVDQDPNAITSSL